MSYFTANSLSAGYGSKQVLDSVSFSLEKGCLMGILGPNGCGKTTLLRAICGILPHSGLCRLDGAALEGLSARAIAQKCSYIPQKSGISIDISALDVVLMGYNPHLRLLERPDVKMRQEAIACLEKVGLGGREEQNYQTLSEGQKQLCILARTLCFHARLLLLDEPESALDFQYRYKMLHLVREQAQHGAAIMALHDPGLALNLCDRLLLMENGRILGILSPHTDSIEKMEEKLGLLYGPVSLCSCRTKGRSEQLVMLREEWTCTL